MKLATELKCYLLLALIHVQFSKITLIPSTQHLCHLAFPLLHKLSLQISSPRSIQQITKVPTVETHSPLSSTLPCKRQQPSNPYHINLTPHHHVHHFQRYDARTRPLLRPCNPSLRLARTHPIFDPRPPRQRTRILPRLHPTALPPPRNLRLPPLSPRHRRRDLPRLSLPARPPYVPNF